MCGSLPSSGTAEAPVLEPRPRFGLAQERFGPLSREIWMCGSLPGARTFGFPSASGWASRGSFARAPKCRWLPDGVRTNIYYVGCFFKRGTTPIHFVICLSVAVHPQWRVPPFTASRRGQDKPEHHRSAAVSQNQCSWQNVATKVGRDNARVAKLSCGA